MKYSNKFFKNLLVIIIVVLFRPDYSPAQTSRILLEGQFQDWDAVPVLWSVNPGNVDKSTTFLQVKASNDDQYLFLYLQSLETFLLQESNGIELYLDTDNNPATGRQINNLGAEVVYYFGQRSGKAYVNNDSLDIGFAELFTVIAPNVWSDQFEFSFSRSANLLGADLFTADSIQFCFRDNLSAGQTPVMTFGFTDTALDPLPEYSISKQSGQYLRVMTNNVQVDRFFEEPNKPSFQRLYQAVQPNIIGLEEIYNHSAAEVVARMEEILPSPVGEAWQAANIADNFLVTRFQIINYWSCGPYGNGAFYLDLRPEYNTNALVLVAHPPCCANDAGRQIEVDAMAAFVRDAKAPGGDLTIPEGTPIIIMGDMNFVGDPQQLQTLLGGDIVNESEFGNDFTPDWDGSDFIDAQPYVTGLPMSFTWGIGSGPGTYSKGRLDYIIYSGSALTMENSFVLYTPALPVDSLSQYGLQSGDSESAADHFAMISDFTVTTSQTTTSIISLRQNDADGVPVTLDEVKTVTGVVTIADGFGATGPAYIQDGTAGVAVYGSELVSLLSPGDSASITAKVGFYRGLTELVYDGTNLDVTVFSNTQIPAPVTVSIAEILNQQWNGVEALEGSLLWLNSVHFVETGIFEANINYHVTDQTDTLIFRVDGDISLVGNTIPAGAVNLTGVLSQYKSAPPYDSGYQLQPRFAEDVEEIISEPLITLRQNDADGVPVTLDEVKNVSGIVTIGDGFGAAGPAYIQDGTAGVAVYGSEMVSLLSPGDSVSITAKVGFYRGLTELVYDGTNLDISIYYNTQLPEPQTVTIADILNQQWNGVEALEGSLLEIDHVSFVETGSFTANTNYLVTDQTDTLIYRVDGDVNLVGSAIPTSAVNLIGVLSQYKSAPPYDSGYQLQPRSLDDVSIIADPKIITVDTPLAGQVYSANTGIDITWTSQNISLVTICYWSISDAGWDTIAANINAADGEYLSWISPAVMSDSGYIKIEDAEESSVFAESGVFYIQTPNALEHAEIPETYALYANYPNPFNPLTQIEFALPTTVHVRVAIYDLSGRQVAVLTDWELAAGRHRVTWNAGTNSSGIYMVRMSAGSFSATRKLMLVK